MEPFGLLNLLKSLLPDGNAEEPSAPPKDEEKEPAPPPVQTRKENACLDFLEAHEKRAKRKK